MYDYDSLTTGEMLRYGRFWRDRYDYMCQRMPPLLLYAWHERIVVKPTTTTVRVTGEPSLEEASIAGTPFVGARENAAGVDRYYLKRFPWRHWQEKSMKMAAKRIWNAEVRP